MIVRWIHIIFSFLLCCSLMAQETPAELLPPPPMVSISSYGLNNGLVENCLSGAVLDKKGRLWLNPCEYAASERGRNFFQFDGTKSHFFSIREELQNATKKRVPLFVAGETKQGFLFGSDRLRSSAFMWHPDTKEQYFFDFEEDERLIGITEANELGLFSLVKQENTLRIYHLHPKEKKLIGKIQVPNISELVNMGTTELFPFVLSKQKLWTLTMAPSLISFDLKKQEFEVKPLESFFGVKPIKRFWPSNDVFLRKLRILSITEDELFLFLGPYGWYSYKISEQKIDPITWLNEIFVQKGTENLFINMSIDLKGNILFQFGDYSYGRLPEADNVSFLPTILMDQNRKLYDYSVLTERIKSSSQYDNVLSWAGEYYSNDFKQEMVWATFAGLYTVDLQPQAGIRTYPMSLGSRAIAEIDSQNIIFSSDIKLHAINLNQEKEVKNLNLISKPNVHTSIIPFKGRQVWLTSGNQLLKYDYESGKVDTIDLGLMIEKFGFVAEDQMIFFPYKANAFLYNINTRQKKDVLIKGLPFKLDIHINDIYISSESSIWLATKDGLWHIDRAKEEVKLYDTDDGLPENHIMCIELGENGKLWLGTLNSGVVIFDPANNSSKVISEVNGLSKNIVTAILTDEEQNRWVATFDGITVISPQGKVLFELSEENGLTHNEFNKSSYLKLSDGRMIFGGVEGLNLIDPIEVKKLFEEDRTLNIYLNSLTYYDNEKEKESIYTGDVSFNKPILIPSANRYLKLDFALSEYGNTMNHTYAYRVIPAKKKVEANNTMEWINLGPVSDLTLNTLMAGDYVVQIRGFDQKGKEAMAFLEVPIKVEQFFYKTWWFYVLCSIPFLLGAFIWIRRNFSERKQLQVEVERRTRQILEDKETIESQAEELRNLDRAKNRFFTNISHEFRTPLTLILGMADQIEQEFKKSKEKTSLIKKNGANLLELINQMLELQKLEIDQIYFAAKG
ncbi:MAG: histidine kinase dimerization/phospho-acceptor domain-containing protein [Bacteroidota bacterium]